MNTESETTETKSHITSGEWKVSRGNPTRILCGEIIIADTRHLIPTTKEEAIANAHLIAASKDMYKALKELLNNMGYDGRHAGDGTGFRTKYQEEAMAEAEKAISKAEGKE